MASAKESAPSDILEFYKRFKSEPTEEGQVGWLQKHSQELNFIELSHIWAHEKEIGSVLDVGCGMGALYPFLLKSGKKFEYFGIDVNHDFISVARVKYPDAKFDVMDFMEGGGSFDYVVGSGLLSLKIGDEKEQMEWVQKAISKLYSLCSKGVGLNFLSTKAKTDDGLAYYSPLSLVLVADKITRNFVLNHDFKNDQFSFFLYRGGQRILPFVTREKPEAEISWLLRNGMHGKVFETFRTERSTSLCAVMVGVALCGVGEIEEAIQIFNVYREEPLALFYLGYAYLVTGNKVKAREILVKARRKYEGDKPTLRLIEKMEVQCKA